MSYDAKLRTKWALVMRIWVIIIMVPVYFFIPIVTFVNTGIGNLGRSFSLVCVVLMLVLGVVSFLGVLGIKEKGSAAETENTAEERLRLREIARMFIANKPLMVHTGAFFLSNIVFTLSTAISIYFLKWYYSADLATGVLKISPYIFISMTFLSGFITGTAVIPQVLLWTECADYAEFKTGRKMNALINSVNNIIAKALGALSSVITGGILIAVGYSVNSETGNYMGDVANLPGMVFRFGIFLTVIPFIVMLLAWLMYRFLYPITPELQKEMMDKLAEGEEGI